MCPSLDGLRRANTAKTALQEVEKGSGQTYVEEKLPRGSLLLELVYDYLERRHEEPDGSDAVAHAAEAEAFLQGGADDFPSATIHTLSGLYKANITCVSHSPGKDLVFTGTGDGTVQAVKFSGKELWATWLGHGGAISLALSHNQQSGEPWLIVGSMDGTVTLLDATSGTVLYSEKPHAKYVVRVIWAPCCRRFATASWDGSIATFELQGQSDSTGAIFSSPTFTLLKTVPFPSAVQDLVFLPGGIQVVVALRDTNLLRMRSFPDVQVAHDIVNMNALGDHHVSFSARQLAISPDEKYLLVSTDTPRILLLRIQGWTQLCHPIVGLPMDAFHTSVGAWHSSGFYVMAAAAGGQVYVFHVGTGKVVAQLKAHQKNVRWLDYDPKRNLLFTCSFDRTVKVFACDKSA